MTKRITLKDLPEEEMAKVKQLVHRLEEEKTQKNKYQQLYERLIIDYDDLQKKYNELEKDHNFMKAQLSNSKMAIIKARQAYNASRSAQRRRIPTEEEEQEQQFEQSKILQTNKWRSPQPNTQNKSRVLNFNDTTKISEKPPLNSSSKQRNSSKKKEIINLRKQIEQLTEEMKTKERSQLPLSQKMKQCQKIKNRYKKPQKLSYQSQEEPQQPEECKKEIQLPNKKQPQQPLKESAIKKATKPPVNCQYDQSFFDIIDQLNHN